MVCFWIVTAQTRKKEFALPVHPMGNKEIPPSGNGTKEPHGQSNWRAEITIGNFLRGYERVR
jgi:hypothetical protein